MWALIFGGTTLCMLTPLSRGAPACKVFRGIIRSLKDYTPVPLGNQNLPPPPPPPPQSLFSILSYIQVPFILMMLAVLVLRAISTTANIREQAPSSAITDKMLACVAPVS
jgi:hypothetical protein